MSQVLEPTIEIPKDPPSYDIECLPPDDLLHMATVCHQKKSLWELAEMEHIAEIDRRELYLSEGLTSTAEWVANTWGNGYLKAAEKVDIALCLSRCPKLKEAFRQGRFSYDHLRALAKVVDEDNEEELISEAEGRSVKDTYTLVKKRVKLTKEDSKEARAERWLEMRKDEENRGLFFFGVLPEELGSKFKNSIDCLAKEMPDDPLLDYPTPIGVRRADALCALVDSELERRGSKAQLVVFVDAVDYSDAKGVAHIEGGPTVPMETARRLSCDSRVRVIVRGASGEPIALARNRREPSEALAQMIRIRAGDRCEGPNCNNTKNLINHHIIHWEDSGPTEYENLILLCPHHHYLVHEGGYKIIGKPPKIWLVKPNRAPIKIGPPRATEEMIAAFDLEFAMEIEEAGRDP